MPFQVYLMPTTASPPEVQIQADVRAAASAEGGRLDHDGGVLVTSDGVRVALGDDDRHFLVDKLSPGFCRVVFDAAQRSNSTVDRGGSDLTPLQMKGSSGATLYVHMRTDTIADPPALCARLGRDLQERNRAIREDQASGVLGADQQLPGPPPSPGTEARLSADPSGVAAHCDLLQQSLEKRGLKIVRKVVSQNAQYGVVWRADVQIAGEDHASSRLICWRRPGRADYSFIDQPLQMFDPTESVPPLAP
jgi:hypothetical protein